MPVNGGNIPERQWSPQTSWAVGDTCWYILSQNEISRYECLIAHVSTSNSQPWNNPHLWCSI
ncbi:hypothetical protein ARMGADRAFT_1011061 [Armillaria gallica]|uniref:Uncharacterized protein n=1 Tax=Armillaria gallica TaxID=47427 RepID=A0A2H3E1H2_ARMGA|nr:hypothetical protein ARMGADRAFT_1011061 [Armillaria gallica]